MLRSLLLTCCMVLPSLYAASNQDFHVVERAVRHQIMLSGTSQSVQQELISNPVNWLPVTMVVPDGSAVQAGEVIARFDPMGLHERLHEQELDRRIDQRKLDQDLIKIDNKLLQLQENISDKRNQLRVLQARRSVLQSLPIESDIRLAEGEVRLARLNADMAGKEAERGRDRHERELIGTGELARLDAASDIAQARLDYAIRMLELARESADPLELEHIGLEIANLELDLEDAETELAKQHEIAELQRANASRRLANNNRKIRQLQEDLDNLEIKAPIDGFVLYTSAFEKALEEFTGKMPRNVEFVRIHDASSLQISVELPEHLRAWYQVGDEVIVHVPGSDGVRLHGSIKRIADIPRDIEDTDKGHWGERDVRSGVKVYDIQVHCPQASDHLRPGQRVQVQLQGQLAVTAPCLPLAAVLHKDDGYYTAVDGIYREIHGSVVGAWFLLEDGQLPAGTTVQQQGLFADSGSGQQVAHLDSTGGLTVSGELIPHETTPIMVGTIHWRGGKLSQLAEENSMVEAGSVLAVIDGKELEEQIEETSGKVEEMINDLDSAREEYDLLEQQSRSRLKRERNNQRMAEIDHTLASTKMNETALAAAVRDRRIATVQLQEAEREHQQLLDRDASLVSDRELQASKRQLRRRTLQDERARLREEQIRNGVDAVSLARSERDLLRAERELATSEKQVAYDLANKRSELAWRERSHTGWNDWLDELKSWRDNLTLTAPIDGVVQYNVAWSRNGLRKIEPGMTVYRNFRIMTIADTSRMSVRVAVPEAYFTRIEQGMTVRCAVAGRSDLSGRVERIEFLFEDKRRNDTDIGLYSEREPSGETVFYVHVLLDEQADLRLQPGGMVTVAFPIGIAEDAS